MNMSHDTCLAYVETMQVQDLGCFLLPSLRFQSKHLTKIKKMSSYIKSKISVQNNFLE